MEDLRSIQYKRLKDLTKQVNEKKSRLEKEHDLVRMLKLDKLVKKLERTKDMEGGDANYGQEGLGSDGASAFCIDALWARCNTVLLHFEQVKEEEEQLSSQHRILKQKLNTFKNGITVNDEVINLNNLLLVVNGKMRPDSSQLSIASTFCKGNIVSECLTVVDANHAIAISHAR